MTLAAGTMLGPYEILAPLGAGGMGEVYQARDTRLARDVAVKVVHPRLAADPERLSRFEKEARAAAQLDHPNILVVHDVGAHEGTPFIVSELLRGESLRKKLGAPLSAKKAVDYAIQIAHGLAAAHEKGIVHRDIKPENLFVTKDGRVKILDFGVAKLLPSFEASAVDTESPTDNITRPGLALGTVAYMSPEQVAGKTVDARSDLFSLGVVLYEMLAGKHPFQKPTNPEVMTAILKEDPPDLSETNPSVPAALEKIVRHCLEKEPDGRFQSARDVVFAIEALPDVSSARPAAPMSPAGVWMHRHRTSLAGLVILAATLAVAGVLFFGNRKHSAVSSGLPSVLALPCTVYGAPESAFLTDAVPGTISTFLSQVEGLDTKVPPTSFEVEKVKGDLTKLAELYQVSTFIVTSITTSPGRFDLNVQLVDAATRKVKWGKQYEGPRETYNELARQAAEGIRLAVRPAASTVPPSTISSEAELALRQGDHLVRRYRDRRNQSDFDAAVASFTRALTIDPSLAAAAAKIGQLFVYRFNREGDTTFLTLADSWVRRALGIDPRCGEAWTALSAIEERKPHGDSERTIEYAVKGVAFAPREAVGHRVLGMCIGGPGSNSLFVAAGLRSFELDPLETSGVGNAAVGLCLQGRPEEALTVLDRALDTGGVWPMEAKGFVLTRLGRLSEAESTLKRYEPPRTESSEVSELWRHIRFALAVAQRDDATSEALARHILASVSDSHASANLVGNAVTFVAPALARMGRANDAIRILEKGIEVGAPPPYDWLLVDPDFQSLRGDPRFAKVLAASRDGAAMVARILGQARSRGELPPYLEEPLDDLVRLLKKPAG